MLHAVQVARDGKVVRGDLNPPSFVLVEAYFQLIDFGIANDTTSIQRDHRISAIDFMSPEPNALELSPEKCSFKVRCVCVWRLLQCSARCTCVT